MTPVESIKSTSAVGTAARGEKNVPESPASEVLKKIGELRDLYHRLILVVGPMRKGRRPRCTTYDENLSSAGLLRQNHSRTNLAGGPPARGAWASRRGPVPSDIA